LNGFRTLKSGIDCSDEEQEQKSVVRLMRTAVSGSLMAAFFMGFQISRGRGKGKAKPQRHGEKPARHRSVQRISRVGPLS
jgi:hypothetical protein